MRDAGDFEWKVTHMFRLLSQSPRTVKINKKISVLFQKKGFRSSLDFSQLFFIPSWFISIKAQRSFLSKGNNSSGKSQRKSVPFSSFSFIFICDSCLLLTNNDFSFLAIGNISWRLFFGCAVLYLFSCFYIYLGGSSLTVLSRLWHL